MLTFLRRVADRVRALAARRDPGFPAAEREFVREHPACVFCGRPATTAHHTYPVHAYRELEMDRALWVPVCKPCHRPKAHAGNWSTWVERAALLKAAPLFRAGKLFEAWAIVRSNVLGPKRPEGT